MFVLGSHTKNQQPSEINYLTEKNVYCCFTYTQTEMGIGRPKPEGCLESSVGQEQINIIQNMSGKSRTKE